MMYIMPYLGIKTPNELYSNSFCELNSNCTSAKIQIGVISQWTVLQFTGYEW